MTETANYAEMSVEQIKARAAELRHDFSALSEGERSDDYGARASLIRDEFSVLDQHLGFALMQQAKENIAPSAATGNLGGEGVRSIGEQIFGAKEMVEWIERGMPNLGGGSEANFGLFFEGAGSRAIIGEWNTSTGPQNAASNADNTLLPVGQPIPPIPRQGRLYMRDLMPVMPTTLSVVPYVRELNPTTLEGSASAVAEGGTKPDVALSFSGQSANITVIAGNVSPSKQLWSDAPLVVAYINQRLPYLIKFKEDNEFLAGSGTWPDITGIKNTAGIQSQAEVSTDFGQTIGQGIAKVENVDGTASAVVMNPGDAWTMFTNRASGGSGTYDAGTPFSGVDFGTIWGLPVLRSRVYAAGTCLVGDFQHGAMILDREQVNVQIYPQHSTYAAQNAILVQAEERVGLMVPRPDLFVNCTI